MYEPTYAGGVLELAINYAVDYFPYGKVLREYVNTSTGDPEKFLTTQHERDKETGLDYRGARFYDSDIARFLSLDPLAKEFPAWSAYNYVMGNPISLIDPTGRSPEEPGDDKKKKPEDQETLPSLDPKKGGDLPELIATATRQEGASSVGPKLDLEAYNAKTMALYSGNVRNMLNQTDWYGPSGKANAVVGAVASAGELSSASFRLTNGLYNGSKFSPKWYESGWSGGSKARITTYKVGSTAGLLGRISFGFGVAMDIRGMMIYKDNPNSPDAVHPAKAAVNTGFGAMGLSVNPLAAIMYFGVDAFYPGGWTGNSKHEGAIRKMAGLTERNREIVPNFNLHRDMPGGF
ncbi:RHS repeat-associated core domain-containing protein [Fluviicola sp. SGL-29]|nr:RHS repeat-associated core domain-containing protein [Fluviicola sp. SGL-29]